MTIAASILAAIEALNDNAELMDAIVNGPASGETSIVDTPGGPVKTLARISAESSAFDAALVDEEFAPGSNAPGVLVRPLGLLSTMGEVQATPTPNTMLDRLKTIAASLAGTLKVTAPALGTATATVASGQQSSNEVDCSIAKALAIRVPAGGLNGVSSLKFTASPTSGGTFLPVCDEDDVELIITIASAASAGAQFDLPDRIFAKINYLKVVTQTTDAETTYTLVTGA